MIENPFLEGSEEVPPDEVKAAALALAKEAAQARVRASAIRDRAAQARARKEASRKAEMEKINKQILATRNYVMKTVANIPKASERSKLRPAPKNPESYAPGSVVTSGAEGVIAYFLDDDVSTPTLVMDAAAALVAITFAILILMKI